MEALLDCAKYVRGSSNFTDLSLSVPMSFSLEFLSSLLRRGLSLTDTPSPSSSPSLVDQFARDNVGNYVLQSILKRLHREMLCLIANLSGKGGKYFLQNRNDEQDMCSAYQLVSTVFLRDCSQLLIGDHLTFSFLSFTSIPLPSVSLPRNESRRIGLMDYISHTIDSYPPLFAFSFPLSHSRSSPSVFFKYLEVICTLRWLCEQSR